mmetsp:Transcript_16853/g.26119  ORF Transcript_16853/g.26119 Transcript_16853/m.26119 type:complete len:273 (+) Transcript_16853:194-1012(+)
MHAQSLTQQPAQRNGDVYYLLGGSTPSDSSAYQQQAAYALSPTAGTGPQSLAPVLHPQSFSPQETSMPNSRVVSQPSSGPSQSQSNGPYQSPSGEPHQPPPSRATYQPPPSGSAYQPVRQSVEVPRPISTATTFGSGRSGVGLKLSQKSARHNVMIEKIQRDSAADRDGRLAPGDFILKVDEKFVDELENAKDLIQGAEGSIVTIEAVKPGEHVKPFQVSLARRSLHIDRNSGLPMSNNSSVASSPVVFDPWRAQTESRVRSTATASQMRMV